MNLPNIENPLKVVAQHGRPTRTGNARGLGDFEKHLREAASLPTAEPRRAAKPASSTVPPAQQSPLSGDTSHNREDSYEPPLEEPQDNSSVVIPQDERAAVEEDEVLLSAIEVTLIESAPIIVAPAVATGEILVTAAAKLPVTEDQNKAPLQGIHPEPTLGDDSQSAGGQLTQELLATGIQSFSPPPAAATGSELIPDATDQQLSIDQGTVAAQHLGATVPLKPAAVPSDNPQAASTLPEQVMDEAEDASKQDQQLSTVDTARAIVSLFTDPELFERPDKSSSKEFETSSPAPSAQNTSAAPETAQPSELHSTRVEFSAATQQERDPQMSTVDRARFVQRVANAFRSAQQNDSQIQLRLSPPELGSLKIEIAVRHGVLTANLETETPDARRLLLDNLPALRQRLAEQDIRIEKFEVDVRRDGGQQGDQAGAQDRQAEQQSQRAASSNRIRASTQSEVITTRVPRASATSADANLDVRI